jgi:hypothetical protein
MKKTCVASFVLFFFSTLALAQDRPKWEIFGGYQYTYSDYGPIQDAATAIANNYGQSVSVDHNLTMTGGNFSIQKNVGKRWAAVLDIGGMNGTKDADLSQYFQLLGYIPGGSTQLSTFRTTVYTITGGPQFNLLKFHQAQVFVRGMGGASRSVLGMDDTTRKALNFLVPKFRTTTTDPAVMAGAGVQYPVWRRIFVRATADYVHPFSTSSQNYLRVTGGIGLERLGRLF